MPFTTKSLVLAAALAATSAAQSTELQMFNAAAISVPTFSMEASVIDANAVATTLAVSCADSEDECELDEPITVTQGPSTFEMDMAFTTSLMGVEGQGTQHQACAITGSTEKADCTISMEVTVSTGGIETSTSTATETAFESDDIFWAPVKVTAGVDKLTAPKATETPDAAAGHLGYSGAAAAAIAAAAIIL